MTRHLRLAAALALATAGVAAVSAQSLQRIAASVSEITANAVFFHNRTVAVVAAPTEVDGIWHLQVPAPQTIIIAWRTDPPTGGSVEIHGVFYDVGRFESDDSRLQPFGASVMVRLLTHGQWPERDHFFVMSGATWTVAPPTTEASLRDIALTPARFEGQTVTVRGRFRGQNLFGDAPIWPRLSQWDFVLQNGDAAVWVTGKRPKGRGFDLDPKSRRDTTHYLAVTGVVKVVQGLPTIVASDMQPVDTVEEPEEAAASDKAPPPPPAPTVAFSAPLDGETGVSPAVVLRIQFSRPMRAESFTGRVTVRYPATPDVVPPKVTTAYKPATQSLEVTFAGPLASYTRVAVDLLDGIKSADGQALAPVSIGFTTGG